MPLKNIGRQVFPAGSRSAQCQRRGGSAALQMNQVSNLVHGEKAGNLSTLDLLDHHAHGLHGLVAIRRMPAAARQSRDEQQMPVRSGRARLLGQRREIRYFLWTLVDAYDGRQRAALAAFERTLLGFGGVGRQLSRSEHEQQSLGFGLRPGSL
ncbi:hypothetical protein [Tahibacter sp.]|uniref:hypothetical protein n=1 Tax=Tahibacter sp. TaxID=2056211 RepID=UPI0028C3FC94|nr:hypothetical protein [Tahibacter sp.]